MNQGDAKYEPLAIGDGDSETQSFAELESTRKAGRRRRLFAGVIVLQALFNIVLLGVDWSNRPRATFRPLKSPGLVYSPLREAVEYTVVRFNSSLGGHETEYMGVGDDVDARWAALFQSGILQIPKEQARLLADPTSPIPGDEENYVMAVEVFHQLHCLNMFRKRLHPEYYPPPPPPGPPPLEHLDHCIDILRQSVMCTVDTNPIGWEWDETRQINLPRQTGLHTCRDFNKILDWTMARRMTRDYNATIHVPSDL